MLVWLPRPNPYIYATVHSPHTPDVFSTQIKLDAMDLLQHSHPHISPDPETFLSYAVRPILGHHFGFQM